jgi:hypothetical protein
MHGEHGRCPVSDSLLSFARSSPGTQRRRTGQLLKYLLSQQPRRRSW